MCGDLLTHGVVDGECVANEVVGRVKDEVCCGGVGVENYC